MPTFTSQPTAATVRRARRRQRSQKYRARPQIQLSHNSFTTRNRTRTRTRQSRDRASFDVEDCFNVTQDQGYHRDSDVHLGSGVRVDGKLCNTGFMTLLLIPDDSQPIFCSRAGRSLPFEPP